MKKNLLKNYAMTAKRLFTVACAALLTFGAAQAKLIFQESFDDPNGTVGQLCAGATNTTDFFDEVNYEQTRWWSYNGSSNYIKIEEGTLSYPGYQTTGFGNKAYLWSTGADDVRSFASQAVTSGKVYLSAIINVDALKQKADADYFLCLGDHANSYFLGRLYAKSVQEDGAWVGYKLGIAKNNESANYLHYTSEVLAPQKNVLVVIEYEFVAGDQNDVVRLYVNPTKETSAPTVVCVPDTTTGGGVAQGANAKPDAGQHGIFGVFMRQGSNTPKVFIDEIKVTTAWADIWVEKTSGEIVDDSSVDNIAALKEVTEFKGKLLKTQPVVINVFDNNNKFAIQDESGAIIINDAIANTGLLAGAKVGDKLNNLTLLMEDSNNYVDGLPAARISSKTTPAIVSSGNAVTPFEVTLAEATQYGPACVKISDVEFTIGAEKKFTVGLQAIAQGEATADLNIPNGCDIIGEDIPAKATVKAIVTKNGETVVLQLGASADVTNRVAAGSETGVENTESSAVRVQKVIRDGQLVIVRDGVEYTATGSEVR
jgi:hypothetical protein